MRGLSSQAAFRRDRFGSARSGKQHVPSHRRRFQGADSLCHRRNAEGVGNIFGAIARFKAHPWTITAAEVGYRILNAFHPARSAQVHGIGYAGDFNGIRVVADAQRKSKMSINLGKGFIEGITPRTLEKRAGDLIRAVSMVVQRKEGEIEPK